MSNEPKTTTPSGGSHYLMPRADWLALYDEPAGAGPADH